MSGRDTESGIQYHVSHSYGQRFHLHFLSFRFSSNFLLFVFWNERVACVGTTSTFSGSKCVVVDDYPTGNFAIAAQSRRSYYEHANRFLCAGAAAAMAATDHVVRARIKIRMKLLCHSASGGPVHDRIVVMCSHTHTERWIFRFLPSLFSQRSITLLVKSPRRRFEIYRDSQRLNCIPTHWAHMSHVWEYDSKVSRRPCVCTARMTDGGSLIFAVAPDVPLEKSLFVQFHHQSIQSFDERQKRG